MAIPPASVVAVCSTCGQPLNANGDCLACLLRTGLEEEVGTTEPLASLVFGDFEVAPRADGSLWELGRGAMGVTYLAVDNVLRRKVALKVIEVPAVARGSQAVRERFLREARIAGALRHPNVAAVFQFGASPDGHRCYYAMELVEGETLEARIRRDGPLKVEVALEIAIQVTRALMAAATQGLIHRDLKPGNIMLTPGNAASMELEVKVIDFGLAKAITDAGGEMDLTHGQFVGTPNFASPEQFGSGPVDARSDIYSLGATLWFALTGLAPRSGSTLAEIRDRQTRGDLPVEQLVVRKVPEPLVKVLRSTLAVDPGNRPASAPELMDALESCRKKLSHRLTPFHKVAALIGVLTIVAAVLFVAKVNRQQLSSQPFTPAQEVLPEKSIAVLPLQNLSDEKENVYFADGIQDQILTKLASVADLKVISRTSTAKYKSKPENLKTVSQELGVATVLEGTVQRAGGRVRVNVQLIDARTDTHLWAKSYDRELKDVFDVQSEVSQQIADALRVKLSPSEATALAVAPTRSPEAYDLFLQGEHEMRRGESTLTSPEPFDRAASFYRQALTRDPNFALAAARLAQSRLSRHWYVAPFTAAELDEVKSIVDRAAALAPDLAEAHVSLALFYYWGQRQYDAALAEFQRALELQPNNATARVFLGAVYRRQGQWDRALTEMARVAELDPRDPKLPAEMAGTHLNLRQWSEARRLALRSLAIEPKQVAATHALVFSYVNGAGDIEAAKRAIASLAGNMRTNDRGAVSRMIGYHAYLRVLERDFAGALKEAEKESAGSTEGVLIASARAAICVLAGDGAGARRAADEALPPLEAKLRERPDDVGALSQLRWVYLALGREADALRVAQQTAASLPIEKDAYWGPSFEVGLAEIQARVGEPQEAIKTLRRLLAIPAGASVSLQRLKIDPVWDPLRNDPEFQQLLLAPE